MTESKRERWELVSEADTAVNHEVIVYDLSYLNRLATYLCIFLLCLPSGTSLVFYTALRYAS